MVPPAPTATPWGSPGSCQRLAIFWSRVGTGVSGWAMTDEVTAGIAARRSRLIVDRVRKRFDDRVGEEPLAHLPELTLDLFARLATIRKRDTKQLAGAHIFHPFKPERAQRMLDGLPLRVENGRLQLDDDGGFHGGILAVAGLCGLAVAWLQGCLVAR